MLKRTSKTTEDLNLLAAIIAEQATGTQIREKNPSAVALGRLGGLKGGKARAAKMTPDERRDAARKAALARWQKGH